MCSLASRSSERGQHHSWDGDPCTYCMSDSVVREEVVLYVSPAQGTVWTQGTRERFLPCVDAEVLVKVRLIPSLIRAMGAGKRLLSRVRAAVLYEVTTVYGPVSTIGALIES